MASKTPTGAKTGEYAAANNGVVATPPTHAKEDMPHKAKSKRNSRAAKIIIKPCKINIIRPDTKNNGAELIPEKFALEAMVATTTANNAEASVIVPDSLRNGVYDASKPNRVANNNVHEEAVSTSDLGI